MWEKARPIDEFYKVHKGERYSELGLELVDSRMEAYGDRNLYRDREGNYWEEYFSIGD